MTEIQKLALKIQTVAGNAHWANKQEWSMFNNMLEELAGMAEALPVVGSINDIPEDKDEDGYSDNRLIDLNGWSEDFAIGHYDHNNARWIIHDDDKRSLFEPEHMTYRRLPLKKYNEKK